MNIQTNYNQPSFRASFSKDPQTTAVLKEALSNSTFGGYPLYHTMQSLANMNSEDSLSLRRHQNSIEIINDRTGRNAEIYQYDKNYFSFIFDGRNIRSYDMQMAICDCIGTLRRGLFDDVSLKHEKGPHFNLSTPKTKRFIRNSETSEYYKKINRINREMRELNVQKEDLMAKANNKEKEYTLSLLG